MINNMKYADVKLMTSNPTCIIGSQAVVEKNLFQINWEIAIYYNFMAFMT